MDNLQVLNKLIIEKKWEEIKKISLQFVRSQDHLAIYNHNATGWILSAFEVAQYYPDKLDDIFDYGVASLPVDESEPAKTIKKARESLGISQEKLAEIAKLNVNDIIDAENNLTRTPIQILQKIAQLVNIDEAKLSVSCKNECDLSYRLRKFNQEEEIKEKDVMAFSEAAWVAQTQQKLEAWLKIVPKDDISKFEKSSDYGHSHCPVWKAGYDLAKKTRQLLNITEESVFLRHVCENLGIPIIQTELSPGIAGATISTGGVNTIVIANDQRHNDPFIRRMTIAHELGHLLWDTEENLNKIYVDKFENVGKDPQDTDRKIEARANAFAVDFIAPIESETHFILDDKLKSIDEYKLVFDTIKKYGISPTSAIYHLNNKLHKSININSINKNDIDYGSWDGIESYGIDYFPINSTPISRRGLFSYRIIQCYEQNMISEMTSANYLKCSVNDFKDNIKRIKEMFVNL